MGEEKEEGGLRGSLLWKGAESVRACQIASAAGGEGREGRIDRAAGAWRRQLLSRWWIEKAALLAKKLAEVAVVEKRASRLRNK